MYRGNDEWRNYRARFLALNDECYACGAKATVVDHLVPHKGDRVLFEKTDNHIPLCEEHHNYVSAKFDSRYKPGSRIDSKIHWLNRMRVATDSWTPKRVKVLPRYKE